MPDKELKTISATQSAALFDLSPYTTRWLLWRVFSGIDPQEALDEVENERMFWGKIHEPAIFHETLRRLDLEGSYNANQDYVRHPYHERKKGSTWLPIGCTPDGEVWHPSKGKAVVQVKCTDWMNWKEKWTEDLPPPEVVCQVQHEMLVIDAEWAVIPCLINGNELRIYEMYPDKAFQDELLERARAFMASVEAGEEPDPLGVPMEQPALLRRELKPDTWVDLTESEEAYDAIQALRVYTPQASTAKKEIDKAKAKLIALANGADKIRAYGYGAEIQYIPTKESAVELPKEVASPLAHLPLEEMPEEHAAAVRAAMDWRKVTRKAGISTKITTWEAEAEGDPAWLEAFDVGALN